MSLECDVAQMFGCASRGHTLPDVPGKMPETARKMRALPERPTCRVLFRMQKLVSELMPACNRDALMLVDRKRMIHGLHRKERRLSRWS